eukprot:gnl/MRDRNA2_/MRDRNA2_92667_c0_seq1.p1 gnl/MRDRNA2_/MRDRNA2_92667_c0~~gnl/MRDRNA2_/MRDRNA2_92667_c0_seq1.p1  ORF type:complete len:215 (+),score=67.74 gnl/MRDRNA2_/MRDRNA2_92667_c0_seq1:129-773(+)
MVPVPEVKDTSQTYYDLLGITDEASAEEIKAAFRKEALLQHPDKGGDKDRFDELQKAFRVLDDPKQRDDYDEMLWKQEARAGLVEGVPEDEDNQMQKSGQRIKTLPSAGAKHGTTRQDLRTHSRQVLKALADDMPTEQRTAQIWQQYQSVDKRLGKEKQREWLKQLTAHEKNALRQYDKEKQKQAREKVNNWLQNGPGKPASKPAAKKAGYPAK